MSHVSVEPEAAWLGSRRFFLLCFAALAIAIIGAVAESVHLTTQTADPVEIHLYGQGRLAPGQGATFRVLVKDGKSQQPIANAAVAVALTGNNGRRIELASGRTQGDGFFVAHGALAADCPEGEYQIVASATAPQGHAESQHALTVVRSFRVLLTTDKPLYQPGQVIHMRALAMAIAEQRPAAMSDLVFEVQDAKGNKVFKQRLKTSAYGIASADFALADQVSSGDYSITALLGGSSATRSVQVRTYVLPKFSIEISTDRAAYLPGSRINGELRAIYTFGQPVVGARVHLVADEFVERFRTFATIDGITDAEGRYRFSVPLGQAFVGQELASGNALVKLSATIGATAGGEQQKSIDLIVSSQPLRIELVPESGELVRGVQNRVYLVTSYPEGRPAAAHLSVKIGGVGAVQEVDTSSLGVARIVVLPEAQGGDMSFSITAVVASGQRAEIMRTLPLNTQIDGVLLRPDRAIYHVGETARLEVLAAGPGNRVFLDVVKDHRTVMMHALEIHDGHGAVAIDLPPDLIGTLQLCAYMLRHDGQIVRDTRLVQVLRKDELVVKLQSEKPSYAPGEQAFLDVNVSHADGTPAPAALGVVGVDEAVYALYDLRPGLEQLYFALQEELLKPRYEIHAHLPPPTSSESTAEKKSSAAIDEAQTVLLAAAEEASAIDTWTGLPYSERLRHLQVVAEAWFRQLTGLVFLAPLGIFAFLFLIAAGYALRRLFRRHPIDLLDSERSELSLATGSLLRRWFLGLYLPLIGAFCGEFLGSAVGLRWRERETAVKVLAGLGGLIALGLLFRAARRVRSAAPKDKLPLFRKVMLTVPYAYLCLSLGTLGAIISMSAELLEDRYPSFAMAVATGLACLYMGALSVARQTALRPVSIAGWFWILLSRPLFIGLPALLLMFAAVGARKSAPQAVFNAVGGQVREEMIPTAPSVNDPSAPGQAVAAESAPRVRRHFPETLLFRPEVITDDRGHARLEVPLADSITTWRIDASAVTQNGELGAATLGLRVFQDFFVDIEFPATLTQHDEVSVPISVFNYLDKPQAVRLDLERDKSDSWFVLNGPASRTLTIAAKSTTSLAFRVRVETPGRHTLRVKASGSTLSDAVERQVSVLPDGLAVTQTINGRLEPQVMRNISIPKEAIDGASDLYLKIYPGAFSQVVEGLDSIFQMPSGCFEQTSSTTYPSVLALDYLRRTKRSKPDIELKALNYIGLGYQRLLSFEVPGGGFEWFGKPPAHNLLTAYGLLEFHDMAKVYAIDPKVIERTRAWLLSEQKNGRFTPTTGGIAEGAINQYQGGELRASAYIGWALAEAGEHERLSSTLDFIAATNDDRDPYTLALRALALYAGGRGGQAAPLIDQLEALAVREKGQVHFTSKSAGLTYGRGDSLEIETTALVAQALLRSGGHSETAHAALSFLIAHRDSNGTWNTTQATIAAMRALLSGTEAGGVVKVARVALSANGVALPEVQITPDTSDIYRLISLRSQVKKGENTVALTLQGSGDLAYQIVAVHYLPWKLVPHREQEPMSITVRYDATSIKKDAILGAHVSVRWNQPDAAEMTLVDLGIPPSFEVLDEDLDKLVATGIIRRYTRTPRQLLIYLDRVVHEMPVEFDYRLRARFPVRAQVPASRAYPYYQPEAFGQAEPVELTVL